MINEEEYDNLMTDLIGNAYDNRCYIREMVDYYFKLDKE